LQTTASFQLAFSVGLVRERVGIGQFAIKEFERGAGLFQSFLGGLDAVLLLEAEFGRRLRFFGGLRLVFRLRGGGRDLRAGDGMLLV
jgi:hypothetical protein